MKSGNRGSRIGQGEPCPLCTSRAGVGPDADGHVCLHCGAPRIVVEPAVPRKGGEKPFLEKAKAARSRRAGWGVAAGISSAAAAAGLAGSGILAVFMDYGVASGLAAGVAVLAPLGFALFGFGKVRGESAGARLALGEAELIVATELLEARGGALDARELASLMHVSEGRAEGLLAEAQVEGFLGAKPPGPRVRVDAGGGDDGLSADDAAAEDVGARQNRTR